jgi:hypothetical protein
MPDSEIDFERVVILMKELVRGELLRRTRRIRDARSDEYPLEQLARGRFVVRVLTHARE